tara:strand:- start:1102 stop:1518 length:417 start_codon:yes stop_codon:yes gene_type:complete
MLWFIYALLGAFFIAVQTVAMTKLTQMNMSTIAINTFVFGLAGLLCVLYFIISKSEFNIQKNHLSWLIAASLAVFFFIITSLEAFKMAPNPGYVNAIQAFCAVLVTLVSVVILGSSFSLFKFFGIILVLTGIFIMGYN